MRIVMKWGIQDRARAFFWRAMGKAFLRLPKSRFDLFVRMLAILEHYLEFTESAARKLEEMRLKGNNERRRGLD
jgi:hypothetical protein